MHRLNNFTGEVDYQLDEDENTKGKLKEATGGTLLKWIRVRQWKGYLRATGLQVCGGDGS